MKRLYYFFSLVLFVIFFCFIFFSCKPGSVTLREGKMTLTGEHTNLTVIYPFAVDRNFKKEIIYEKEIINLKNKSFSTNFSYRSASVSGFNVAEIIFLSSEKASITVDFEYRESVKKTYNIKNAKLILKINSNEPVSLEKIE